MLRFFVHMIIFWRGYNLKSILLDLGVHLGVAVGIYVDFN